MGRYLASRVLVSIPMIVILVTIVFLALRLAPGGPAYAVLGAQASPERVAEFNALYHLDDPLWLQYLRFLGDLVRGRFGVSFFTNQSVSHLIGVYFPATLELSIFGMLCAIIIALPLGIWAARRSGKTSDFSIHIGSILIYSVPLFWSGLLLQLLFSIKLGWLPAGGRLGFSFPPPTRTGLLTIDSILAGQWDTFWESLQYLLLPSVTLGLFVGALILRVVRTNMILSLKAMYVRTARSKGLTERRVVYRHALRPALVPVVTMTALEFALLLGGAVVTETTFSWPGLGRFLVQSVQSRDYPVVQGVVVFFAIMVVVVSLINDVLVGIIDPKVRSSIGK